MYLTVKEISRVLGISTEAIRYYVREGIITPKKNDANNYWEYSSDDLMKLSDVLFYRSMNLTIKEIKIIMLGIPLEEIGNVIDGRKAELIREIKANAEALALLTEWEESYKEELALIGKYMIGKMPAEYRRYGYFEESNHMARYLEECFDLEKEDWGCASISFYFNLNSENPRMKRYLSIAGTQKIKLSNISKDVIEEKAPNCLITEVHYSDDVMSMIRPMMNYAAENNIFLSGEFYGRENTNYFVKGKRTGLYKVYAPIIKKRRNLQGITD